MDIYKNILASSSPRRKKLLNQIGFNFTVIPSNLEEHQNLNLPPEAFTEFWAREKAKFIAKSYPDYFIIGADTVVILNGKILGKPKNVIESKDMLRSLSGKTHEVITGVSLILLNEGIDLTFNEQTFVSIQAINDHDITKYIKTYNPLDKAGSYGIQDGFSIYINSIQGCYYNVMGFPLSSFYKHYNLIFNKRSKNDQNK